jgi:predicted N-acetyltransferase YhbS
MRESVFTTRLLQRDEVELVWQIDRREVIDNVYSLENGVLVLHPDHFDMQGWPPGEGALYTPILLDCYDRGGWFCGIFDNDQNDQIVAVAVLESKWIGNANDQLQLKFLHVSRDYRGLRLGKRLFDLARQVAASRGAAQMYVSATPSEHTINFYLRQGCVIASEIDPDLFALEPEDIHLVCKFDQNAEVVGAE